MQPNRRRKIEWDSSSVSSPTKYFKLAKEGLPHPSPNSILASKRTVFRKTQILHSPESYKAFSRTSFAAEDSSSDGFETDDEIKSVVKETRSCSFSRGMHLVNRPSCEMPKRSVVSSPESLKHEVKQDACSVAGPNLAHNTESKGVSKDAGAEYGRKKVENQGAALIYRKALLGALGKALVTKRDAASTDGIHSNSLHCRKEASGPGDNLRHESARGEGSSGRKTSQKEQINICVQQDKKDSCGSDSSSRCISVVSRSERETEVKPESSFQKASVKEENGHYNHSGKEDARPGCSSRHAPGTWRLEDGPELTQDLKKQSSSAKEDINTSVGQNKKKLHRFNTNSGVVANFSRLEGEQKHKPVSNEQQSKVDGENDCTRLSKKESWTPENNSRRVFEGSRHEEEEVFKPGISNRKTVVKESVASTKQKNGTKEQCTAPSVLPPENNSRRVFEGSRHEEEEVFKPGISNRKTVVKESVASTKQKNGTKEQCTAPSVLPPENNSRRVFEGSRHEEEEVFKPGISNRKTVVKESGASLKQKNGTKEQCTAPSSVDIHSETKIQFENFQRTVFVEPSSKLVFVDERDAEVDQKHPKQEKEPLEGSDWSDIEDAEPLAAFSQEDSIQNHRTSETKDTSALATEFVMYPSHLYGHKMTDYVKYWTKTSTPERCSPFSSPCEVTSFYSSYSSQICDISLDTSVAISSDTSKDKESSLEDVRRRPRSLGSSLACEKKDRRRTEVGPYIPIFSTPRKSDSSATNRASHNLRDDLPRYLEDGFIDTHCHLDMLYSKMAFNGTFSKFRKIYDSTFPEEFEGCIADFCDPRTLNNSLWEDLLKEDMVWGAFGCHPHFARYYSDLHERNLLQAMRHPKAVAFGEMGLDYSYKCSTEVPTQHKVFERQLNLAVSLKKPLVIHCRNADDDLLKIMKKCVPKDYKIHRHCFTGRYNAIKPLLDYFPNLTVGFTALLTYPSANEARETVKKIPVSRIVVETDAPYFLPRQVPKSVCQYSHPGVALHTVRELARLKEIPLSIMLAILRQNTKKIYDL